MVYYLVEFPINWKKYKTGLGAGLLNDAPDAEWAPMRKLLPNPWMGGRPLTPHEKKLFKENGSDCVPWEFGSKAAAVEKAMSSMRFHEQHPDTVLVPIRITEVNSAGETRVVWFDPRPEARQKVGELGGIYS